MIFVTVGTHEQPFNRLIEEVDRLKRENIITEDVYIQTGFSTYEPQNCKWSKLLSFKEMDEKIKEAKIVITHGGPASFIAPLQIGKVPIVVPRQKQFGEHVNDHQVDFAKQVSKRMKNIIPVYDISELEKTINDYKQIIDELKNKYKSNNERFIERLEIEINSMYRGK